LPGHRSGRSVIECNQDVLRASISSDEWNVGRR
jgi:hypothetical protein